MAIGNTKTADISHNGVVTCGVPKRLAIKKGTTRMPTKPIKPATITKPAHKAGRTAAALLLLGITQAAFHLRLAQGNAAAVRPALWERLVVVAGFIGLIGLVVLPFFTAKRLGIAQAAISKPITGPSTPVQ